jgi:glutaredoxin
MLTARRLSILAASLWPLLAAAQYKVVGPDGSVTYTDRPPAAANNKVTPLTRSGGPAISGAAADSGMAQLPPELRQAAARYPVLLYTTTECASCDNARQLLQQRGIPYNEKRVLSEDDAVALERGLGWRTVPSLTIGPQALRGLTTLEWKDVSPASDTARPKRRYGSAAIFDPPTRSLVQFAGFTSEAGRFQDTQSFGLAANSWTDWTPAGNKPQVRCLLTAAFDQAGRRMIIYGGQRSGPLDDIWAFDLATRQWANLTPTQRPAGRMWASSFVDKNNHFMIFGGSGNGNYNETWEFDLDAKRWTQLQIENPPPARNAAMGAYVESEDRFIVFGGTGNGGSLNDVWELSRKVTATVTTVSAASFDGATLAPESIVAAFGSNRQRCSQHLHRQFKRARFSGGGRIARARQRFANDRTHRAMGRRTESFCGVAN